MGLLRLLGWVWLWVMAQPAAPPCKAYGESRCCDPKVSAHLPREAVYAACGQSEASYLGEKGEKDTCSYYFKVGTDPTESTVVQVYAPAMASPPAAPNDPFFSWKKIGKVFMIDKARSPKATAMMQNTLGLWFAGKDYIVSVKAATRVCGKPTARKLAGAIK
jgi:hypothetical protein